MQTLRTHVIERQPIPSPSTVEEVGECVLRSIAEDQAGCIIPARLLPPLPSREQFHWLLDFLPGYEPKGTFAELSTPPDHTPFHTDYPHLLREGATHKLHQIPSYCKLGAFVTLGMTVRADIPHGSYIEEVHDNGDCSMTVFEAQTEPGDITLFRPFQPHCFAMRGDQVGDRPFMTLNIGPR